MKFLNEELINSKKDLYVGSRTTGDRVRTIDLLRPAPVAAIFGVASSRDLARDRGKIQTSSQIKFLRGNSPGEGSHTSRERETAGDNVGAVDRSFIINRGGRAIGKSERVRAQGRKKLSDVREEIRVFSRHIEGARSGIEYTRNKNSALRIHVEISFTR